MARQGWGSYVQQAIEDFRKQKKNANYVCVII